VDADQVGVAVNDGAVMLSGEVGTYLEKSAALKAAMRVRGVTAVADEIVVRHRAGVREDVDIARDAADAIASDAALFDRDITVAVEDAVVTLYGTVSWNYQRTAAVETVSRIRGVTSVYDRLTLDPALSVAGHQAQQQIVGALARNAQTDADAIRVVVRGSEVLLTGTVLSSAERDEAVRVAWATPGVTFVHERLEIRS
jgi:osmotically-inducible protein OsmY